MVAESETASLPVFKESGVVDIDFLGRRERRISNVFFRIISTCVNLTMIAMSFRKFF